MALQQRNERVAYARKLGIDKPNTLKAETLEAAIAEAEQAKAATLTPCETCGASNYLRCPCDPFDDVNLELEGDHFPPIDSLQGRLNARTANREAWLLGAVDLLIPLLEQAGAVNLRSRKVSVSVGFPSKTIRKRIGECWADRASANGGVNHMFVSPRLDDPIEVLGVLAHELIHADDNGASNHGGHFRRVATALGLTGKMTSTTVGEDLKPVLKDILSELGEYPHVKLNLGNVKKQSTRLIKVHCIDETCPYLTPNGRGYTIRVTQSWIEVGLPSCPCGAEMAVAE